MKFLVTGCSSYIARYVIRRLIEDGHNIVGISRFNPLIDHESFHWINHDLSETPCNVDEDIDVIIHMAAQSRLDKPTDEYIKKNIYVTYNTKEMAIALTPKVVIYASSLKVYGEIRDSVVTEETCMTNADLYGMTKYLGEKILEEGIPTVSIRMPGVIAVGSHGWINSVYHKLKKNELIKVYNAPYNHLIHAFDIFGIVNKVCEIRYFKNDIFNVCASGLSSSLEVTNYMHTVMGSKSIIEEYESDGTSYIISNEKLKAIYQPLDVLGSIALYLDEMQGCK